VARLEQMLSSSQGEEAHDVCALPLVRRVAALLDMDPYQWSDGDALPRGWHFALFTTLVRQSELGSDGFPPPELANLSNTRLMLGGRRTRFNGDIPIGAVVRRVNRLISLTPKEGRSGRLTLVKMSRSIFVENGPGPVITEEEDMIFREVARDTDPATGNLRMAPDTTRAAEFTREIMPDETMLFRYCAVTFNAHRIHYDHPYTTKTEGYPGLVVNGALTALHLLELFRSNSGREPVSMNTRNVRPLLCGHRVKLNARRGAPSWDLWAMNDGEQVAVEAQAT
jgi:3-methylfumaryl-CoA hydratase